MSRDVITMSKEELKTIIKEAMREELFAIGLRTDEEEHIEDARRDFAFLRRAREAADGIASKIGWAVIAAIISGVLWFIWLGAKIGLKQP